ncbi:ZIP zinc transporter-domain-containing protein [Phakopsora pachyrhizi]|nr:ZIP zinc transporter-domain-containing protein [Phakopsora pachyrhizi]
MSLAMFISTFITGYLPLIFSRGVSTLKFKKLSILSAGLIIGTALTVIIPEGIESVYRYQESTSIPLSPPSPPSRSFSTFVGFIFHSVADGIALGASSFSSSADQDYETIKSIPLDLVVFVAIVVHKAPAAFGLITYLMSMGLSKSKLRKILLAFSVAAPFGALMTWTTLTTMYKIKYGSIPDEPDFGKTEKVEWWAGMILLFSGGTFLYIATHALEDIRNRSMDSPCSFSPRLPKSPVNQSRDRLAQESNGRGAVNSEQKISLLMSSFLMVLGMVLPLILSSSLRHKH